MSAVPHRNAKASLSHSLNHVGIMVCIVVFMCSSRFADAQSAIAPTLRAETKVFVYEEPESPIAQTLTLFDKGIAYDIQLPEKTQITVFDIARGQIILLDKNRKLRTTISTTELMSFMTSVRNHALEMGKGDVLGTGTHPSVDSATGVYRAGVPGVLYIAKTQAAFSKAQSQLYQEFTSWATRLNTYHNPHGAPFARLALNQQMAEGGVFPNEITCRTTRDDKTVTICSEHQFSPMLAVQDRALIFEIGGMLTTFPEVDTKQFCHYSAKQPE